MILSLVMIDGKAHMLLPAYGYAPLIWVIAGKYDLCEKEGEFSSGIEKGQTRSGVPIRRRKGFLIPSICFAAPRIIRTWYGGKSKA